MVTLAYISISSIHLAWLKLNISIHESKCSHSQARGARLLGVQNSATGRARWTTAHDAGAGGGTGAGWRGEEGVEVNEQLKRFNKNVN